MSKTFVTLSTKKGTLQQKIARAEAGREEISAAGWDALVGWRDPAKRPPREKTQLKIGTESAAGWLLSFCPIQCHTALARSKGPPETPRGGAGWGEQSHTACCERERAGSYFNRNTDLRKEERLKNGDANSTSQDQRLQILPIQAEETGWSHASRRNIH